jgi:transposase
VSELEKAQAENKALRDQVAVLQQQLDWLKRQLFGRKSERVPEGQGDLGLLLEEKEEEADSSPEPTPKKTSPDQRGKKRETRAQRLPDHLPVREERILPLAVQAEPEAWRQIGEETTNQLEKEPGYLYVRRIIRPRFVKIDAPHQPPLTSPAPPSLIPSGFYGSSLLAEIVLDKFLDHLPLYRIEQRFLRLHGVKIPRQTMSDNLAHIANSAELVVTTMDKDLWATGYVQADETPIRCLDRERPGGSFRGYLWTVTGPPGSDVIFRWADSRGHEVFKNWMPADFCGVVQRDGYSGYVPVARQRGADVLWAGCWAHARRKFFEAAQAGDRVAKWFVHQIGLLYSVEKRARENDFGSVLRQRERAVTSSMVLARLKRACMRLLSRVRPTSLLGKALAYTLSQWQALEIYRDRGDIEIDNNQVENAIRPTAVGKKNWLFIGAPEAGSKAATFYTLLGSCLRRGLNPRDYLIWLFARLPTATNQNVADLTPGAYAKIQSGATDAPRIAQSAA